MLTPPATMASMTASVTCTRATAYLKQTRLDTSCLIHQVFINRKFAQLITRVVWRRMSKLFVGGGEPCLGYKRQRQTTIYRPQALELRWTFNVLQGPSPVAGRRRIEIYNDSWPRHRVLVSPVRISFATSFNGNSCICEKNYE